MAWLERGLDIVVLDEEKRWVKITFDYTCYSKAGELLGRSTFTTRDGSRGETYLMPVVVGTETIDFFLPPNIVGLRNNGGAKVSKIPGGYRIEDGSHYVDPNTVSGWTVWMDFAKIPLEWNVLTLLGGLVPLALVAGVIAYQEVVK
jgi:hypothetical protein